jgi:hypothetical protein
MIPGRWRYRDAGAEAIEWEWIGVLAGSPGDSDLEVQQDSDFLVVKTHALWLRFERVVDRWQHVIEPGEVGSWRLTSVEGDPEEPCPESPAYQDLWFEDRGGGRCEIQLMGQAGGSIYSAAVAVDETEGRITFDVCARRKRAGAPVSAQSRYRVQSEGGEDFGASWLRSRDLVFETSFPAGESLSLPESGLGVDGGFVVGYPSNLCNGSASEISQWRWQYSLKCAKQA